MDMEGLREKVEAVLKQFACRLLKVNNENIDVYTGLNEYGFDSISFAGFADKINQGLGLDVTPAVFFEHTTLHSLAKYLTGEYQELLSAHFRNAQNVQPSTGTGEEVLPAKKRRSRFACEAAAPAKEGAKEYEPVAVIGMSGVFPQARDLQELWKNLVEGKDCITEIPPSRWDWREYYGDPQKEPNKTNIIWGGFIEGVDEFDPLFFGISPREAGLMDPQQRLLMIHAWKAIEDAGYSAQSLSGTKTAIFVGTGNTGYSGLISRANLAIEGYTSTGLVPSVGPNRMSYFLNIHGPSEPIETACSSSLIAVCRAVCALNDGSCEMAIAGGVNTILTPEAHISFNKAGMLSEDGRCKTFSDKANGYVRGEGAGMLFLKKLKDAQRDKDHIYGVIIGAAENHGGRANSLTAPNPKAQADLLVTAYTRAGIDPRTVTYIEAHGTGTELGDPIEINGMKTAFQELYRATGDSRVNGAHCGLGSVKTNIGHLELAAGIAGMIKVLLQMKNRTLVKSLHCETINPYIKLEDSPFYIVRETAEWKALKDPLGNDIPRRAGVSSFGFGGANAHVVIEEYIPAEPKQPPVVVAREKPALVVLSAKNEERLKEQARQLLSAIEERHLSDADLVDMAYTLQVGREAMDERLAMMVWSIKELQGKLAGFVRGQDGLDNVYRGQVRNNRELVEFINGNEEIRETYEKWLKHKKYGKVLELWVKGARIDWHILYEDSKPRRISLPTYPFARERYWVPDMEAVFAGSQRVTGAKTSLHPLLHENTSSFAEQRFTSVFSGGEFFLADHAVMGRRILPGTASLEMVREAVERSIGHGEDSRVMFRFKNVAWLRPIAAGSEPLRLHVGLYPENSGPIAYRIYSEPKPGDEELIVYSQGFVEVGSAAKVPSLDLESVQAQCSAQCLEGGWFYQGLREAGVDYGPGYRGIEKLYTGRDQVLAKLSLPPAVSAAKDEYVLHPALLDSAVQASLVLQVPVHLARPGGIKISMPFAVDELIVYSGCVPSMWALVRKEESGAAAENAPKYDIDLCDEKGRICVKMSGFSSRTPAGKKFDGISPAGSAEDGSGEQPPGTVTLVPVWEAVRPVKKEISPARSERVLVIGGSLENRKAVLRHCSQSRVVEIGKEDTIDGITAKLKGHEPLKHILWAAQAASPETMADEALIEGQKGGVLLVFRLVKALLGLGYGAKNLNWTFVTNQTLPVHKKEKVNPVNASIHGLLGSMAKEYPNWKVRLVDVEEGCEWPLEGIFGLPYDLDGNAWVYRDGEWRRQKLAAAGGIAALKQVYRPGGVYVVIGGAGGLGEIWSEYMISRYQAKLVWLGRKEKDGAIQAKLDKLSNLGEAPWYIAADATDGAALQKAYQIIKNKYPRINGVVHSAVGLLDRSLSSMDEEHFRAVLAVKVDASVRIAQVFNKEPLDFVLFFSSLDAFTKDHGKSGYSSGCVFMDVFAHQLSREWDCAVKTIDWGYWGNVGVGAAVPESFKQRLARSGIGHLEPRAAMEALELLMNGAVDRLAVLRITKPLAVEEFARSGLLAAHHDQAGVQHDQAIEIVNANELEKARAFVVEAASQLLALEKHTIDGEARFEEIGFDQVKLAALAGIIEQRMSQEATPAVFIECGTLNRLAEYLVKKRDTKSRSQAGLREGEL
jgi:polyketide synthase PksN